MTLTVNEQSRAVFILTDERKLRSRHGTLVEGVCLMVLQMQRSFTFTSIML